MIVECTEERTCLTTIECNPTILWMVDVERGSLSRRLDRSCHRPLRTIDGFRDVGVLAGEASANLGVAAICVGVLC